MPKIRAYTEKRNYSYAELQVAKKTFNGILIGYVIGWWKCKSRWNSDRDMTFQSYRQGVIYPDEESAKAQRDIIENLREGNTGVKWEKTEG
jgi:hypothetical protein